MRWRLSIAFFLLLLLLGGAWLWLTPRTEDVGAMKSDSTTRAAGGSPTATGNPAPNASPGDTRLTSSATGVPPQSAPVAEPARALAQADATSSAATHMPEDAGKGPRPPDSEVFVPAGWHLNTNVAPDLYELESASNTAWEGSSARLRCAQCQTGVSQYGRMYQAIDGTQVKGATLEFSASIKRRETSVGAVNVWVRVYTPDGMILVSTSPSPRKGGGTHDWSIYSAQVDLPPRAAIIRYGVTLNGPGTVWIDNAEINVTGDVAMRRPPDPAQLHPSTPPSMPVLAQPTNLTFDDRIPAGDPMGSRGTPAS